MLQCDTSYLEQKTKLTKLAGYLGVWRISTWREKKKERESSLHLTDKHHPLLGIVATLLAVLSAGMFGAACVAASGSNGHAGLLVGFVGICSLVVAGVGFVLAWISLHQEDIRPHFPTIASICNGLLVIFYLMLYIWGTIV